MTDRKANWQGMNWLRQDKRLAIYLRDGLACVWCGHSVENGAQLAVDHVQPYSKGGSNHETNLVTSCVRCNCSRGNRSVATFAVVVAAYVNHGIKPSDVKRHVAECAARDLKPFRRQAKDLIASRGSAAKVLAARM
jgi:hypothetical protein